MPSSGRPSLLAAARRALSAYRFRVLDMSVVSDKGDKATLFVRSERGGWYLKKAPYSPGRLRFVASISEHLGRRGVRVPRFHPSRTGEPVAEVDGACWILIESLSGRNPNPLEPAELSLLARGMARLHRESVGAPLLPGSEPHSLLGSWPKEFERDVATLAEASRQASERPSDPFWSLWRRSEAQVRRLAELASARLDRGSYRATVAAFAVRPGVCHQDLAPGNCVIMAHGGLGIYDLDAVAYEIPARDLRKIILKVVKKHGWSMDRVAQLIRAYRAEHPIGPEHLEAFWVDLSFPHLTADLLDKWIRQRAPEWNQAKWLERLRLVTAVDGATARALPGLEAEIGRGGRP